MFSTRKNWILNTLGILCIPQNFRPRKGPEYLYQLFDVFPKQTTCEMKALQVCKSSFSNDFMMNRELILLWPEITLDIYLSAGGDLFLSYWGQVTEFGQVVENCFSWVTKHDCFSRHWVLLGTRKLAPKKLKYIYIFAR